MLEVVNLSKNYGSRKAVDAASWSVEKGQVLGLLGPNGAGKTTTMKMITGYMYPTSGDVLFGGENIFEEAIAYKKKLGYLPETPPLYLDMYVRDYLSFVASLKQVAKNKIKSQVDQVLERTGIKDVSNRIIGNLSKGYRQRVGIAQALIGNPQILVFDEPTVGLDPRQVSEVRDLIRSLKTEHTVVLSTHILPEVKAVCDKIVVIHQGKIVTIEKMTEGLNLEALFMEATK